MKPTDLNDGLAGTHSPRAGAFSGGQKDPTWARYTAGTTVLTIVLVLALLANARGVPAPERRQQ